MSLAANAEECLWIHLAPQLPWDNGFYKLEPMHLPWNALHFFDYAVYKCMLQK